MDLWDAFFEFAKNNPAVVIGSFGAVSAFLFGSGAYWQYRKIQVSVEEKNTRQAVAAGEMQTKMLAIHQEILSKLQSYVGLRDDYIRSRGNQRDRDSTRGKYEDGEYDIQNRYHSAVRELAHLINTYNDSEARLSILEERQPRWFNMNGLVPPGPLTNVEATVMANPGGTHDLQLKWSLPDHANQLQTEVLEHLKLLFRDYGQEIPDDEKHTDRKADRSGAVSSEKQSG